MEYRVTCLARPKGATTLTPFRRYAQTVESATLRLAEDQAIIKLREQGMDVRSIAESIELKGGA